MLAFAADNTSSWDLHLMLCPPAEADVSTYEPGPGHCTTQSLGQVATASLTANSCRPLMLSPSAEAFQPPGPLTRHTCQQL